MQNVIHFSCSDSVKSEGLAYVKVGDKIGHIDKAGKIVINPQFDDVGNCRTQGDLNP